MIFEILCSAWIGVCWERHWNLRPFASIILYAAFFLFLSCSLSLFDLLCSARFDSGLCFFSAFVVWATFYLCLMSHFISSNMCAVSIWLILTFYVVDVVVAVIFFLYVRTLCIYHNKRLAGMRWGECMHDCWVRRTKELHRCSGFFIFIFRRLYKRKILNAMMNLFLSFFYSRFYPFCCVAPFVSVHR